MKQQLRLLIVTTLLAFSLGASAQNLIFYQNTQSQAYLFKQGGGGTSAALVDYFIQRIAQGSNKPVARTEYILVHDDIVRLTKVGPMQFDVLADLGGFRLTGDQNYRGFSMADILVPGSVKFRLEHRDKGGRVKQGWDFAEVPLGGDPATIANFRATDSSAQFSTDIVAVADKQFIYTDANRLAFDARTGLIDDYYATTPTLEPLWQELQRVDPGQFDRIDQQDTELKRIQGRLDAIRAKGFEQKLALSAQNDPAGFLRRFGEMEAMARDKATRIADTRSRMHALYHERGLALLQQQKPGPAKADFLQAVQLKPGFAPSHIELARLSQGEGKPDEAVIRLQNVFKDMQMDDATRQKATQLAQSIYQGHVTAANAALQQNDPDKALVSADLAKDVCNRIPASICDGTLENVYQRAHRAIYLRHVSNGVKAENEKRLEAAESDALSALAHQQKHATYVGQPREASELLRRVRLARYNLMLADAERDMKAGNLPQAENRCREAIAYQAANSAEIPDPAPAKAILDKVMAMKYTNLIGSGKTKAQALDHNGALQDFEAALAIEKDHVFKRDTTLGTKIKVEAKQVALATGRKGLELARSNRLPDARIESASFTRMMEQYVLAGDKELEGMRKDLQDAIFSQECINATNDYNQQVGLADANRGQKRYLEANELLTKALAFAQQNAACQINTAPAIAQKNANTPAAEYQERLRRADDAWRNSNYNGSIGLYNEAGDLFFNGDLGNRFGLAHAPLIGYVQAAGKLDFHYIAAGHFCDKKEYEDALTLVQEMANRGYTKSRLKVIQGRVGRELAIRDKQADPSGDPKVKAAVYTRGSKAMAGLGKAYIKQWKSM